MYVDKKRRRWPYFISAVLILAIAGLIVWRGAQVSAANLQEESAVALRGPIPPIWLIWKKIMVFRSIQKTFMWFMMRSHPTCRLMFR